MYSGSLGSIHEEAYQWTLGVAYFLVGTTGTVWCVCGVWSILACDYKKTAHHRTHAPGACMLPAEYKAKRKLHFPWGGLWVTSVLCGLGSSSYHTVPRSLRYWDSAGRLTMQARPVIIYTACGSFPRGNAHSVAYTELSQGSSL